MKHIYKLRKIIFKKTLSVFNMNIKGGPSVGRDETAARYGVELVITATGSNNVDVGPGWDGYIRPPPP